MQQLLRLQERILQAYAIFNYPKFYFVLLHLLSHVYYIQKTVVYTQ